MSELGKTLMLAGIAMCVFGAVLWLAGGKGWLGRLPGDVHIEKGNFQFFFPLATCVVISIVLSLLLWFFRR